MQTEHDAIHDLWESLPRADVRHYAASQGWDRFDGLHEPVPPGARRCADGVACTKCYGAVGPYAASFRHRFSGTLRCFSDMAWETAKAEVARRAGRLRRLDWRLGSHADTLGCRIRAIRRHAASVAYRIVSGETAPEDSPF